MVNRFDTFLLLPRSQLDLKDRTYAITPSWFPVGLLRSSVEKVGLMNPLHVEPANRDRYRIVSGFRRAQVASDLEMESVPCWVRRNGAGLDLFVESLMDNIGSRPLHDLEKASAVFKLTQNFNIAQERVINEFLPLLEIRPTAFHLRRYVAIARLPDILKRANFETRMELETALLLAGWPEDEQALLVGILRRFRLNVNTNKKLAELLDELRRKTGRSVTDLWNDVERPNQADGDTQREFDRAYRALFKMRMPRLSELEERYDSLRSALRLPSEIRIQPPQYFEGDAITVSLSAKRIEELRQNVERLSTAARTDEMEQIFRML